MGHLAKPVTVRDCNGNEFQCFRNHAGVASAEHDGYGTVTVFISHELVHQYGWENVRVVAHLSGKAPVVLKERE